MSEPILFASIYMGSGLVVAATYRLIWGGPFRLRHIAVWPLLHGCLFWDVTPPRWAGPAKRQTLRDKARSQNA